MESFGADFSRNSNCPAAGVDDRPLRFKLSSAAEVAGSAGAAPAPGQRRLLYALSLSLVLHLGGALAVVFAGSLRDGATTGTGTFAIQEVVLASKPVGPESMNNAPAKGPAASIPSTATAAGEADEPEEHEPAPAESPQSADSREHRGEAGLAPLASGMTHGYFSGLADGSTLRDDIRGYYFELLEKINRQWWDQAGLLKKPLAQDGVFELLIQREGTVVSVQIVQGTGSTEADRLLTEIIGKASPLPPLPATYNLNQFLAPLRIKAPLFLFRMKS